MLTLQTAVNTVIRQKEITGKIKITCCVIPPDDRGSVPVVSLSNYDDPSAYQGLPDIKHLEICSDMAAAARRESIDWYEYFPELETLEIFQKENETQTPK